AKGANQSAPAGYYLGQQLLLIPWLFFSLCEANRQIATMCGKRILSLQLVVVPIGLLFLICLWDLNSFFASESHALGLTIILIGLVYLSALTEEDTTKFSASTLLTGCLIALLAFSSKVSTGGIFASGFAYLLLRSRHRLALHHYGMLVLFAVALTWLLVSYLLPLNHAGHTWINPFHFPRHFPTVASINLSVICAVVALCLWHWNRGQSPMWNQILLVMLVVSTAPTLALEVLGGSAYYFINVGTWIAVAVLSARTVGALSARPGRVAPLGAAALAVCVVAANFGDGWHYRKVEKAIARLYRSLSAKDTPVSMMEKLTIIGEAAKSAPLKRLTDRLAPYVGASPTPLVLFSSTMWKAIPYSCLNAPLFVPANVGLPMLMGLRTTEQPCVFNLYYTDYDKRQFPAVEMLTRTEICASAKKRGFVSIVYVTSPDEVDEIIC
ncbi:MAG: hypothetical protein ACRBCJ_04385, partial [Hyphomicrobiaceae bacterium]